MSVPQEFLIVKVPRPEAREKKPGIAARAMVEYRILAIRFCCLMRLKECMSGYALMKWIDDLN